MGFNFGRDQGGHWGSERVGAAVRCITAFDYLCGYSDGVENFIQETQDGLFRTKEKVAPKNSAASGLPQTDITRSLCDVCMYNTVA